MASTKGTLELGNLRLSLDGTTTATSIPSASNEETKPLPAMATNADKSQVSISLEEEFRDRKIERRLIWKLDFYILPLLTTIYFLAQMGRSDVGNANIAGMGTDLDLNPGRYSTISSVFLVGYIIFQPAGTMLLRLLTPPTQFAAAMMAWGIVTVCHLKAHSYETLLVLRIFVGVSEAFIQGAILYLSFWYTYRELALRGAIFYATSTLAGAFNGLLSYAIASTLDGKNGWPAWKWIFFIEGLIPIGFAFVILLLLPPLPEKAKFGFSKVEMELLVRRTREAHNTEDSKLRPKLIWETVKDPKTLLFALASGGSHFTLSPLSNFLPAIILGLGYDNIKSQLMSVIVYACAFVTTIFCGWFSDRFNKRGTPLMISSLTMAIGYIMLLFADSIRTRFAATCVIAMGGFPVTVLILMWMVVNTVGYTKRATTLALLNIVGQLFGIAGNQVYRDPPLYRKGHGAALGGISMTFLSTLAIYSYLTWRNRVKRRNQHTEKATNDRLISYDIIGDFHPDFFYTL